MIKRQYNLFIIECFYRIPGIIISHEGDSHSVCTVGQTTQQGPFLQSSPGLVHELPRAELFSHPQPSQSSTASDVQSAQFSGINRPRSVSESIHVPPLITQAEFTPKRSSTDSHFSHLSLKRRLLQSATSATPQSISYSDFAIAEQRQQFPGQTEQLHNIRYTGPSGSLVPTFPPTSPFIPPFYSLSPVPRLMAATVASGRETSSIASQSQPTHRPFAFTYVQGIPQTSSVPLPIGYPIDPRVMAQWASMSGYQSGRPFPKSPQEPISGASGPSCASSSTTLPPFYPLYPLERSQSPRGSSPRVPSPFSAPFPIPSAPSPSAPYEWAESFRRLFGWNTLPDGTAAQPVAMFPFIPFPQCRTSERERKELSKHEKPDHSNGKSAASSEREAPTEAPTGRKRSHTFHRTISVGQGPRPMDAMMAARGPVGYKEQNMETANVSDMMARARANSEGYRWFPAAHVHVC